MSAATTAATASSRNQKRMRIAGWGTLTQRLLAREFEDAHRFEAACEIGDFGGHVRRLHLLDLRLKRLNLRRACVEVLLQPRARRAEIRAKVDRVAEEQVEACGEKP